MSARSAARADASRVIGNLRPGDAVLKALRALDRAIAARDSEVLRLIGRERLFGLGLRYVDAHPLASVSLTPGTFLWTRDKHLSAVAERLSLAARVTHRARGGTVTPAPR